MQGEELTDSMRRGLVHHRMHRRSVLKRSAAAGAGLLGASLFGNAILAQDDATPEATPVAGSDSGGAATYQVNPAARTPTPNGPTIPPEFDDPKNWSVQGYDLAQTRFYDGQSSISTESVGELGLAWQTPFEVAAAFIPLVANPIGVDGRISIAELGESAARHRQLGGE